MSLIITSNTALEDNPEFSNAFKPYSYQNRLLNTLKIPANSEIALQSAKINKNGLFVLDRVNSGFCQYFGTPIGEGADQIESLEKSTTQPFRAVIGAGAAFRAGGKAEKNVEDMVSDIQAGVNEATFHPSLINSASTTTIDVDSEYASITDFKGFKFVGTQATNKTTLLKANVEYTDISRNALLAGNFSDAGGEIEATSNQGFYVQNRQFPISQNEGTVVMNFSEANVAGATWMCGLSRINQERDLGGVDGHDYLPTYFDDTITGAPKNVIWRNTGYRYADVAIMRSGGKLKVFQSGSRTAGGRHGGIYMNEVIYYGAHNTNFAAEYDMDTNGDNGNYQKVRFTLNNEELSIHMLTSDDTATLLCDFTTMRSTSDGEGGAKPAATKNQFLNAVNATEWAMYPVIQVSSQPAKNKKFSIESVSHYSNYPEFEASKYFNYDWWGWSQTYNELTLCQELEQRDWNNYSRTLAATIITPQKVNASGGMDGYELTIITAKSEAYGNSTNECASSNVLGFIDQPVSTPTTQTELVSTIKSSTVPKVISNISLFIRLNNFTQTSVNARQGTGSKIIAHLPRFDNSGNETGGLYFEPHEKTYLKLNNPQELLLNSFDVDIVYENETLCNALTGKTIVCFHIRDSATQPR